MRVRGLTGRSQGLGAPHLLAPVVQEPGKQWAQPGRLCFVNELDRPFLLPVLTEPLQ